MAAERSSRRRAMYSTADGSDAGHLPSLRGGTEASLTGGTPSGGRITRKNGRHRPFPEPPGKPSEFEFFVFSGIVDTGHRRLDGHGERGDRRLVEDGRQGKLHPELLPDPGDHLGGQ